ncbi:MAG: hypothetical protein NUV45_04165 [Tepidanaerobacteraceae bacterium]|nr:hypothetical protein [Tepidanaerobacteraceae bacterium]
MPRKKSFFWGLGAAALAFIMVPKFKKMARPAIVKGICGVMGLAEKGREAVEGFKDRRRGKETNAQNAAKTDGGAERLQRMQQEEVEALDEIKELKNMISRLQAEINEIRQKISLGREG